MPTLDSALPGSAVLVRSTSRSGAATLVLDSLHPGSSPPLQSPGCSGLVLSTLDLAGTEPFPSTRSLAQAGLAVSTLDFTYTDLPLPSRSLVYLGILTPVCDMVHVGSTMLPRCLSASLTEYWGNGFFLKMFRHRCGKLRLRCKPLQGVDVTMINVSFHCNLLP